MASNVIQIKHLKELLTNKVGTNAVIKNYTTKPLTKPGDNYGSVIMSLTIEVQKEGKISEFHLVAKTSPQIEWRKKLFMTSVTFKREIALYDEIIPTMIEFQRERGMNSALSFISKYYGGQVDLNTENDDDAVMFLENLNYSGFEVVDRTEGFNLTSTKLILRHLAEFHAVSLAIKIIKPEIFNHKILSHLDSLRNINAPFKEIEGIFINNILETAKGFKECIPYIPRVYEALTFGAENEFTWVSSEPFATLVHNDFWVNNIMIKFIENQPVETKFLDFQFITYSSPAVDLIFFLYSSVPFETVNTHFDEFINIYYERFINTLESLKCNTKLFTYKAFLQEIDDSAKHQFWHIIRMLLPILGPKGEEVDISKLSDLNNAQVKEEPEIYRKRLSEVILDFIKRKWI